ncbi:hypothetical protein NBO_66g0013 [Nosema bombycis CQ1]|uniref:Uncharacterized protein n=1 Tax=Nosema bombycis (strain CQ1 / CVCC 102059) TaxID=578461 RepID=R0M6D1_NOSB1|nr:hypothetical protein NBO_66g0013 [Nosema bombycis CQ1]|eukprot:EOB13554.1 hypothetical protein NBO_66g0013 [Nosema bombycis CQ1]
MITLRTLIEEMICIRHFILKTVIVQDLKFIRYCVNISKQDYYQGMCFCQYYDEMIM